MKKKILVLALLLIFTSCAKTENKEKAELAPKKTETAEIENEKEVNSSEDKEDFVLLKDNIDKKTFFIVEVRVLPIQQKEII